MEQGTAVVLYGLEMLYQSVYDLFDLSFATMGANKYCRIAIGQDSIRGLVHPNFKVILIADQHKVEDQAQIYDPDNHFVQRWAGEDSLQPLDSVDAADWPI